MKRNSGFTLMELLIVIVIVGLSLSLAVPNFRDMMLRNRVAYQVNDFLLALNLARSEAMRRGSEVSVQSANNGADSGNEFGVGYCVQIGRPGDSGYSTSCTYAESKCSPVLNSGCVVRSFDALTGDNTLDSIEDDAVVTFGGLGELTDPSVRNIDLCPATGEGRRIRIALVGRSKSHSPSTDPSAIQPGC